MTDKRVELQRTPEQAWVALLASAARLGKVEEANATARYLVMKARYGLNPVRLRIAVLSGPQPDTSVLEIAGRGQDVWGVASRRVIDKLVLGL